VASYSASIILSNFVFETGFLGSFTKSSFIAFGNMVARKPMTTTWGWYGNGGQEKRRKEKSSK
jgi:hypothetical protein